MLTVIEECRREYLDIEVYRRLTSDDVLDVLARLMVERGPPDHIRSDQGPEFTANRVQALLSRLGVKAAFIEKPGLWENGYNESFNGKLRDELLKGEFFYTLKEAKILIERWRRHHNEVRPHNALAYRPPAPAAIVTASAASGSAMPGLRPPQPRPGGPGSTNLTTRPNIGGRLLKMPSLVRICGFDTPGMVKARRESR